VQRQDVAADHSSGGMQQIYLAAAIGLVEGALHQ
jgi:hypothetical protein